MGHIMKIISWIIICFFYVASVYPKNPDPFSAHPKRPSVMLKCQYLGYIKGPNIAWAFIKPVGGEILKVMIGKSIGFGKVESFSKDSICIHHAKQQYCLKRSPQAVNWVATP